MPRYFFHLFNDIMAHDNEGVDFPDIAAARIYAIGAIRKLAAESVVEEGHIVLGHRIEIECDDDVVEVVEFRDAIAIED